MDKLSPGGKRLRTMIVRAALFLPGACAFSIGNNRALLNQQTANRQNHYRSQRQIPSGFSNIHPVPEGGITSTRVDSADSSTRLSTSQMQYLNYGLESQNDGDGEEVSSQNSKFKSLVSDNQQRFGSSMGHGWEGLNDIFSSPSAFSLGWSTYVPEGVSAFVFSTDSSPLVLTPNRRNHHHSVPEKSSSEFLRSFLKTNRKWVEESIFEYGAIVLRGFDDANDVGKEGLAVGKEILRALEPRHKEISKSSTSFSSDARDGFEYYLVSDSNSKMDALSSSNRFAKLCKTNEKSPKRISEISVNTRLTDWRGIHDDLPKNLRRKLEERQLLYTRTQGVPATSPKKVAIYNDATIDITVDPTADFGAKSSSWFRLFGSTNKKAFERIYHRIIESIVQQEYTASSFDERIFVSEAFRNHPRTNEKIWFEFAHRFHWTSSFVELLSDFRRTKNPLTLAKVAKEVSVRLWRRLRFLGRSQQWQRQRLQQREREKTTVAFGDGRPISWWEMHQIRRAIKANTAQYPWKPGDFLLVDRLSMGLQ